MCTQKNAKKLLNSVGFRMVLSVFVLMINIIDLVTDWISFRKFVIYDGTGLTVALGIFVQSRLYCLYCNY
jgi:hypothetical protein